MLTPTPSQPGGAALNANFKRLVDLIQAANTAIAAANTAIAALGTPSTISGSITESQVTGLTGHLAAKLPIAGGALTGDLSLGTHRLTTESITLGTSGILGVTSNFTLVSDDSNFLNLFSGLIQADLTTGRLRFNGNPVAMNDGNGTGGGDFFMDGGNIRAAGDVTAQTHSAVDAFWHNGNRGATATIAWTDADSTSHSLTIEGGIITAAS